MKYRDFTAQEFANDSFFIRWVKHPDVDSDWFWTSFTKEHPASKSAIEEARELISLMEFPKAVPADSETESIRNNLLMMLRAEKEEQRHQQGEIRKQWIPDIPMRWIRIAAAIIILPLGALAVYLSNESDNRISTFKPQGEGVIEKKINPLGQQSVLFLDDGTKVWLNASSKITYLKNFHDGDTRDVYLEGEAFFDVAHNAEKPFIVHTSSLKIKVLGTSFNVKSYKEQKTIETTLVKGKVRIEQADVKGKRIGDVELKPNQRAVFNKESRVINIKEIDVSNTGKWKQERLVFDEESIDQVLSQMEKWYNVRIHFESRGALNCKLTATIQKESLEEVLKLLQSLHDIHYEIEGREVYIEGTFCKTGNDK